jgi:hypothetical protein
VVVGMAGVTDGISSVTDGLSISTRAMLDGGGVATSAQLESNSAHRIKMRVR